MSATTDSILGGKGTANMGFNLKSCFVVQATDMDITKNIPGFLDKMKQQRFCLGFFEQQKEVYESILM